MMSSSSEPACPAASSPSNWPSKNFKVLILEAGQPIPASRQDYMERYYTSPAKMPESPYPPNPLNTDPSQINVGRATTNDLANVKDPSKTYLVQELGDGQTPFCSTYERIGGGTLWHWLGTSLRLLPGDFETEDASSAMAATGRFPTANMAPLYARAEKEIGVAGMSKPRPTWTACIRPAMNTRCRA